MIPEPRIQIRRSLRRFLLVAAGLVGGAMLAASASAQVQMMSHHGGMASQDYPDLAPPPPMQGIGNASMKITTNSEQAQAYFNQGLRLLHDFWDFEAYRAFKEAARLDPNAAMAYWGEFEALKMRGPAKDDTRAALYKAKSLLDKVSDHESYYIRAAEHELSDTPEDKSAYQHEMEALIDHYPNDQDAQSLYALGRMDGYDANGDPRPGELYSQALLRNLLAAHPESAAANHYWIHAVEDSSHPEIALHSADILASLAPNSGHMVHMPGHIYWRIGDYEKARDSFLASMHVDEAYMASEKIEPAYDWNYAHNLAYLIAACAEAGRYNEGLEIAKKLRDIASPTGMTAASFVVWAGASVARVHIRFGDWQAVPKDPIAFGRDAGSISLTARSYADGLNTYAKGMDAIEKGDLAEASRESDLLDASLWRLEAAKPAKKPGAMDMSNIEPTEDDPTQVLSLLGTMSLDLRGNVKVAQGDSDAGIKLIEQAAEEEKNLGYSEPPRYFRPEEESLGYAYLKLQKWDEAREAFNESLRERPKSGHALYGIAQSYALAGDARHATAAYRDFLAAWAKADSDLPQVKQANAWLASHPSSGL
jgi:tetratricopeptide (TPR) repeat protein